MFKNYSVSRNVLVSYFLAFVSQLFFPIAVWLFFYSQFLDFKQIALMTAIGSIAGVLLEVPTGAFADLVGRKVAIVISYVVFSITMIITALTQVFWLFVVLAILGGLVNALYSGSLEALIYDSLKEKGQEKEYDHVVSKMEALAWIGLFVGSIAGGFLFQVSPIFPFYAQAVVTFFAAYAACYLYEPKIDSVKYSIKNFMVQNTQGFKELLKTKQVVFFTILFIIVGAGYDIAAQILGISQAKEYGVQPYMVGILFAIGYIISAGLSYIYPLLRKKFSLKWLFLCSLVCLILSFFFAQYVGLLMGSLLIILRISSSTIFRNTRSIIFNSFFSAKYRATALSTLNLLTMLPYALFAYPIGAYIDSFSPNAFAFLLGCILFGCLLLLLISRKVFFPNMQGKATFKLD